MSICIARKECIDGLQFQGNGVFTCNFFDTKTNECKKFSQKEELEEEIKRLKGVKIFYHEHMKCNRFREKETEKELEKKLKNLKNLRRKNE